jgi:uncharacterized protein
MSNRSTTLHPLPFVDIQVRGELLQRLYANLNRLEEARYQPEQVFVSIAESAGWDGDTEGRTILALTLAAQAAHRDPKYLPEIMRQLPAHLNAQGYLGTVHPDGVVVEQQLSGHGWLLRGLCEYYAWTGESAVLDEVERIVRALALPTRGRHRLYPLDPAQRVQTGSFAGTQQGRIGNWVVSSDTGCDFIFLDGLTHAYQWLPSAPLQDLIEEMIARFLEMDLVALKVQTHATLTALRSLLRYYETMGRPDLLRAVQQRFDLYRSVAMTENYENYNWFERPEWTEPCAVIDSFIVAVSLWRFTGQIEYLELAHAIYYNGLGVEQRYNGGFGCNTCAGVGNPYLSVATNEAHWCCTMRGGEGLARAAQYAFFVEEDEVVVPFFHESTATLSLALGQVTLRETTAYPSEGRVKLEVLASNLKGQLTLRLCTPTWTENPVVRLNGQPVAVRREAGFIVLQPSLASGDVIEYTFGLKLAARAPHNPHSLPGYHVWQYGPLVLGYEGCEAMRLSPDANLVAEGAATFRVAGQDIHLAPLYHRMDVGVWQENGYRRQVLF